MSKQWYQDWKVTRTVENDKHIVTVLQRGNESVYQFDTETEAMELAEKMTMGLSLIQDTNEDILVGTPATMF